ncbi:hypothetical protein BDV59DRAFT_183356 [Aspergillus ambiguus]|uniref:uncharacterized protein n=1 Tax=Aspergillus ambiguus TaxID=176160 RepID=UPI003CCE0B52
MSKATPARTSPHKHASNSNKSKPSNGLEVDASGLSDTLQGHVDDIRGLLQCGICIRPLYEPFTLACGHTFCYSCLTSWFSGGRSNKTCPDCRSPVKSQPAPAYLVRTLVQLFTSRAELLEKGETTAEHANHQREEAEKLDADKKNTHPKEGGLFRGTFSNAPRPLLGPIVDLEDNVVRCPSCSWELEDGVECPQCGYHQYEDSLSERADSELSDVMDMMDDEYDDFEDTDDFWHGWPERIPVELQESPYMAFLDGLHRPNGYPARPSLPHASEGYNYWGARRPRAQDSFDEYEDDEEEDDGEMDSFIDDDSHLDEDPYSDSDHSTVVGDNQDDDTDHGNNGRVAPYPPSNADSYVSSDILSTDDEELDDDEEHDDDSEDDDDDDDEPVRPAVSGNRRRLPSFQVISSSPAFESIPPRRTLPSFSLPRSSPSQGQQSHQTPSAGTSESTAIHVDDSDEGPVGPVRRTRDRGNCRRRVY